MATSEIPTNIDLNTVGRILQLDIFGLNGFIIPPERLSDGCSTTMEQSYGDRVTRDDLALAINSAEGMIAEQLGYNILPTYETQTIFNPRGKTPYVKGAYNIQTDNKGYLIDVAKEQRDFLGTFSVIREDQDNDGIQEVCTLDLSVHRLLNGDELHVYYKDTNVEIKPIKVVDKGEKRTLETQVYNIGNWAKLNAIDFEPLDYSDPNSFETELDVWHIHSDKASPVRMLYNPDNAPCIDDCGENYIDTCGFATHKKFGYFGYNGQNSPDTIEVGILSGWSGKGLRTLDRKFHVPIVGLGVSLLEKQFGCNGDNENKIVSRWQKSILEIDPSISRVLVTSVVSDSMFGLSSYGSYLARQFVHANRLSNR